MSDSMDRCRGFGSRQPAQGLSRTLLSWYSLHKRDLPWRGDPSAYHVWISEIMLQQTRVEAVRDYYTRFLDRFPDIRSLAESREDECLKLWEGLGYYSRARNLRRAAGLVMEQYGGQMPRSSSELRKLPGIGPYTAAAIASIAYGERIPAIDGNLLRVFARLSLYEEEIGTPAAAAAAREYFLQAMPQERPGDFNQALMDLGAGICLPGTAPACLSGGKCPLQPFCGAYGAGRCRDLPVMPARRTRAIEKRTILVIRDEDRILLRRRPGRGLLAGLWEYPNEDGWLTEEEAVERARVLGCEPVRIRPLPASKHIFTHREWHMQGYEIRIGSFPESVLREERQAQPADGAGQIQPADGAGQIQPADGEGQIQPADGAEQIQPAGGAGQTQLTVGKGQAPGSGNCIAATVCELKEKYALPGALAAYFPQ